MGNTFKELGTWYILIGFQPLGGWSVYMNLHHDDEDKLCDNLKSFSFFFPQSWGKLPILPCIRLDPVEIWLMKCRHLGVVPKIPPPTSSWGSDCSVIHWKAKLCRKHHATRWNKWVPEWTWRADYLALCQIL